MNWIEFPYYAYTSAALLLLGVIFLYLSSKIPVFSQIGIITYVFGVLVMLSFIVLLWISLERPPLRTLGETRLWYVFFLTAIGAVFYIRWKYKFLIAMVLLFAYLFLFINLRHPENYDKVLMPALISPWFVPHVVAYILGYAFLGISTLLGVFGLYQHYFKSLNPQVLRLADNHVYFGFGFVTLGLLFGALWAKQAWGHYWTWDPKETWAFLTWAGYLIYIHVRYWHPKKFPAALWTLSLAFIILMVAWFGINILPSAQSSVHVYGS